MSCHKVIIPSNINRDMIISDMVPSSSSLDISNSHDRITIKRLTAQRMLTGLGIFFPWINMQGRGGLIQGLIEESYEAADLDFKIEKAIEWGNGFMFPPEVHIRDSKELADMEYDLPGLIHRRQTDLLPNRLNTERLQGRDSDHPDTILLHDLVEGIRVPLDPDFVEDRVPGAMDKNYKLAHSAVDKSWYKLYLAGFILLFTTTAMTNIPAKFKLNYSPAGWHKKLGSPGGRCIIDYSRPNSHGQALNTKRVKEMAKEFYGKISPVQIDRLMEMTLEQVERLGGWADLVIWKMDLKGAFNLIFFRPDDAGLLAVPLSDGLVMVSMVGSFGHSVTPYSFDVVSRIILADVKSGAKGDAEMCCDDVMGACASWERAHDMDWTRHVIERLLGPGAVAEDKSFYGRRLDFIGWSVDLDRMSLGIARHNFLKTVYGFITAREQNYLSVRGLMKLASWSSRYSIVCRYMRPFSSYLYSVSVGYVNLDTQVKVSDDLRVVIDLWIMFLLLMELEQDVFRRSIKTFGFKVAQIMVNLDASLKGVGLIVSLVTYHNDEEAGLSTREEVSMIAAVGYNFSFDLGDDSGYQNAVEFIAIVAACLLLTSLGLRGSNVLIQGDNTSALSWVRDEKFRAGRSMAAAILFMQLQQCNEIPIVETEHIAGEMNPSDPLSRGRTPQELGYPLSITYDLRDNPSIDRLITGMDPSVEFNLRDGLATSWQTNHRCIEELTGASGGWSHRR